MLSVQEIDRRVRPLFTYVPDKVVHDRIEDWRSHEKAVRAGLKFKGDCDDFALTCAVIAWEEGYALDQIRLIHCMDETGGSHLIVQVGELILDNRMPEAVPITFPRYTWIKSMSFAERGTWRNPV
ncbi:transglutaminase-like cysteine peptidase [Thalassospira aquimaris]|uniref:Transglutaminase-like cysteine peptidase n=1 Tax=Thalassospira aquimaris TaxID=3037796 RepID=A0ABT6GGE3_9PROT|nr:transglutaminase-like cysteine peptidase [Thalassospira sp. FZY0004]MDG4721152.1 transglutaminase-like cysteine peptidase [Thalassospira sp. FZY0004]